MATADTVPIARRVSLDFSLFIHYITASSTAFFTSSFYILAIFSPTALLKKGTELALS
jgi:hypothetical protein